MAHVVLSTYGSYGDLFPFIALGQALASRGHRVTFAVSAAHGPLVERAGFPVRTVHEDREALLPYEAQIYGGRRLPGQAAIPPRLLFEQEHIPTLPQKVADLRAACADADCLVAIGHQHAAPIVAELTGIPWVTVVLTPLFLPSSYFSPVPIPTLPPFRRFSNRISWKIGERLTSAVADRATNAVRATYGLPPRTNVLLNGNHSHLLTALAASPAFLEPPLDWPTHVVTTGFCFYDQADQWTAPSEVEAVFSSDDPVVVVSSGSMSPEVRTAFQPFFAASIAAIGAAGARALVVGASAESLPAPLPPHAVSIPYAPFSQIYPRCAAVIHHGGMGTTAQALRAGLPMLVVPWGGDQHFTATQIEQIGVGVGLARARYTPERAERAVRRLLSDHELRSRGRAVAEQIARENGPGTLASAIEHALDRSRAVVAYG